MRDQFIQTLTALAKDDPSVTLVVGDLGFGVVEEFASTFPSQFFNVGVAEQAMIGISAGLASEGRRVFVYSIANFPTLRCLEQIRNDLCYHNLPVTVCAIGAGLSYGSLGYTHHGLEDLAVMRVLPNMSILSPCDPFEVEVATRRAYSLEGPSYIRLGKNGEPRLHREAPNEFQPIYQLRDGTDAAILATGAIAGVALEAASELTKDDLEVAVFSVPQVSPLDDSLADILKQFRVVTVEEHRKAGGFGSAVLEFASHHSVGANIKIHGVNDGEILPAGSHTWMRAAAELTAGGISSAVRELSRSR